MNTDVAVPLRTAAFFCAGSINAPRQAAHKTVGELTVQGCCNRPAYICLAAILYFFTIRGPRGPPLQSVSLHKNTELEVLIMSRFKLCFIFDEDGDYKPVPYSRLMDGNRRSDEFAGKYFIPVSGYLLEVSHEEYLDYYRYANRQCYVRKEAKRAGGVLSLQSMCASGDNISRELYADVAEQVMKDMMAVSLHDAIALLGENDRTLIQMLYFDGQTEQQCAEVFEVNQSTVNRRKKSALKKLKNILTA